MSLVQGNAAEQQACQFLLEQGLTLRCQNYRTRRGELDIVMQDGDTIAVSYTHLTLPTTPYV